MLMEKNKLLKKITAGIVVFIILCLCLGITTFALIYAMVTVEENVFTTGTVGINLNDGEAVIYDPDLLFEPGMTIEKEFFVENTGTEEIYYKLYFNDVSGTLMDHIEVKITDGNKVIYEGLAADFGRYLVEPAEDPLDVGEKRTLKIFFHLPEGSGNEAQSKSLYFDLCADAVQTKNNSNAEFEADNQTP